MAKERYIDTKFWDDAYIIKLDPTEKLLFIYFLTNPLTNIAGVYEITPRRVAFDTGIDAEMIENILKRFELDKKMFYRESWLIICNFPKYQQYEKNQKIKLGIDHILSHLPDSIRKDIDNLSIPYVYLTNYPNPNSNLNSNTNSNSNCPKEYTPDFETFWNEYPRKEGKRKAFESWLKVSPDSSLQEIILKSVDKHKAGRGWTEDDGKYIPHPTTWLNQARWEDEPPQALKPKGVKVYGKN